MYLLSRWFIIPIVLMLLSGCDPEPDNILNANFSISGEVRYVDVVTGDTLEDDNIKTTITYIDNATVVDGLERTDSGSSFRFGPLLKGDYMLKFELEKAVPNSDDKLKYTVDNEPVNLVDKSFLFENPIVLTATTGPRFYLSGKAVYPDPITKDTLVDTSINISLVGEGKTLTAQGSSFRFGPLNVGDYDLTFEFTKEDIFAAGNTFKFKANKSVTIPNDTNELDEVVLTPISGKKHFISGSISYQDLIKDDIGDSFSKVEIKSTPVNSNGETIGNTTSHSFENSFFSLGPLSPGFYELAITNTTQDNAFDKVIMYKSTEIVAVSVNQDTLDVGQLELSWGNKTALLLEVTDSLENPIPAGVCYYSNAGFLKANLPTCAGSLSDSLKTNSNGLLFVEDIDPNEYYFNVSSEIGSITLNNHESIEATKTSQLIMNTLNRHSISIKKDQ